MKSPVNHAIEDIVAVVLEYHKPDATFHCIKSLRDAGIRHILVWDNSSDAGMTRAELARTLNLESNLVLHVRIESAGSNLGFSAGVNAAIAAIPAEECRRHVLLINNDATINREGVGALFETLIGEPANAIAAPEFLSNTQEARAMLYYHSCLAILTKKKYPGSFAFLSGCCLLVDMEKAGTPLLDEAFFMYGEDVALSLRLQREGFKLAIAKSARVEHIGSSSSVAGSPFYEYHVARGHLLLASRISNSWLHSVLLWPPRLASLAARSLLRAIRAGSLTPIKAFWRACVEHLAR